MRALNRAGTSWSGKQDAIDALTKAAGFHYEYDPKTQQFAHTAAILILTPDGKIAQYYYGIEYPPKDLRLGLVEAGTGKIGNVVDALLLYCYHYDPEQGKYSATILRVLRLAGVATMLFTRNSYLRDDSSCGRSMTLQEQDGPGNYVSEHAHFGPQGPRPWRTTSTPCTSSCWSCRGLMTFADLHHGLWCSPCAIASGPASAPSRSMARMRSKSPGAIIPFCIFMVFFGWGAIHLLPGAKPPAGCRRGLHGRQAMDVEVRTHGRSARDQ